MRPPYYLFYYRDHETVGRPYEAAGGRFVLVTCSIILTGLVAVAFLSGM